MMKKTWYLNALVCTFALAALGLGASDAVAAGEKIRNDVVGCWHSIDDKTKTKKSLVKIRLKGNSVSGRIIKLFRKAGQEQDPKCDKCKGAKKGKKIIGMEIIWGVKAKGWWWKDGKILDPANGKIYRAELWLDKKGKNRSRLKVRGFVAFFYRTQTWHRTSCPAKKAPARRAPARRAAAPAKAPAKAPAARR